MARYPHPINQFNRLQYNSGTIPTGSYSRGSRWNNTHNGQNYDSKNCTAAMGALLIDAHTGGRLHSTPPQIRNAQNDWSGGIGWDDVNVAWRKLFDKQLVLPRDFNWADVMNAVKNEGRAVGVQGDNDQMGVYSCQAGGTFDHAYAILGYRSSDSRILWYDPLCTHARWIPQYNARLAAEKLARAQRGTSQRLFVALTQKTPPPYDAGVTLRYGAYPVGEGRYLARRDNVPVRMGPGTNYNKVDELDHRQSFAARQAKRVGKRWYGTADGTRWVYESVLWYAGPIQGGEDIS